jgi:hypothetical protein
MTMICLELKLKNQKSMRTTPIMFKFKKITETGRHGASWFLKHIFVLMLVPQNDVLDVGAPIMNLNSRF